MSEVKSITPKELYELSQKGEKPYVVDVRQLEELLDKRSVLVASHNPLETFDPEDLSDHKASPIYFICRSGRRSYVAAAECLPYGFSDLYNVEGGTLEWEASGLPTKSGPLDGDL